MNLEFVAKSASKLFSLPEICIKLQDLIYDPNSSMSDIAQLISIDPSLSARLLKIANSSYYSFPSQVDSLNRAINLIGTQDLYSLAMAASTPESFNAVNNNENIDIDKYWRHSVITGLVSRNLAKNIDIRNPETFFLAGLFHNLGKLVILEQFPEQYIEIESKLNTETAPWEVEKSVLEYTFAEVGEALLKEWNMPTNMLDMVAMQHEPKSSTDPRSASLIHIASRVASQIEYHPEIGFDFGEAIKIDVWPLTGIVQEQLDQAIGLAEENCQAMISAMSGKQVQTG